MDDRRKSKDKMVKMSKFQLVKEGKWLLSLKNMTLSAKLMHVKEEKELEEAFKWHLSVSLQVMFLNQHMLNPIQGIYAFLF